MEDSRLNKDLRVLFDFFNELNVRYCILRDFFTIEEINNSIDIDVSISFRDKETVDKLFTSLGWFSPKINLNTYSHKQYYKILNGKSKKIDIIWDLFFYDGKYSYTDIEGVYNRCILLNEIKIPNYTDAILILLFHIVLDKGDISNKNKNNLQRLLLYTADSEVKKLVKKLLENQVNLFDVKKYILSMELVRERNNGLWKTYRKIRCKIYAIKYKQMKVAVIGVDGTGKTSLLKKIAEKYPNTSYIAYMGFKDINSPRALKIIENKKLAWIPGIEGIKYYFSFYFEMKSRIRKAINSKKKLVVYDRYPWEGYDNADPGYRKLFAYVFFKLLIQKPDMIVYLHCPVETSLLRKDDILDVDEFSGMKKRSDNIYMAMKSVYSIDTSLSNSEEVFDKMIECIIKFMGEQFG